MTPTEASSVSRDEPLILVHDPDAVEIVALLNKLGCPGTLIACRTEAEVESSIESVDVIMSGPFPVHLLQRAQQLKWIQSLWAGVDHWLIGPVRPPVPITRMTGVFDRYMAEYVFGHLLNESQRIPQLREAQERREWTPMRTESLQGQLIGIAGFGCIGQAVALMAQTFGMRVWGLRRSSTVIEGSIADRVFQRDQLSVFLAALDILILILPATPSTAGMMGMDQLLALPKGARIVNIGGPGVVDELALVAVMEEGHLRHATLDTFSQEPLSKDSPLWNTRGVTVTPLIAGRAKPDEVAEVCIRNLREFLSGRMPGPVVDLVRGY